MVAFEAYTVSTLVELNGKKIESICLWQDHILAGLHDGTLLFLREGTAGGDPMETPKTSQWQVVRYKRSFGTKAIVQMYVTGQRGLLLSLSEDGVNLHTLPDLLLKCQANRSFRASCFGWEEERSVLAIGIKRKVILYSLTGMDLVEFNEASMGDVVLKLQWCREVLVVAMKRNYVVYSAASCTQVEILNTGASMQPSMSLVPTPVYEGGACSLTSSRRPSDSGSRLGREDSLKDLCGEGSDTTPGAPGENLLTRDTTSLFLTSDGKPSRRAHLTWNEVPLALVVGELYCVAICAGGMEVRSITGAASSNIIQKISLPDMAVVAPLLDSEGRIYIASSCPEGRICRLVPVSLQSQARTLAELHEYQEALERCAMLPDCDAADRRLLEHQLRVRYGQYLYSEGEVDEGLAQLSMCTHISPLVLLVLFPSLVPNKYRDYLPKEVFGEPLGVVKEIQGEGYEAAVFVVLPYLLSHRTKILSALGATPTSGGRRRGTHVLSSSPLAHCPSPSCINHSIEGVTRSDVDQGSPQGVAQPDKQKESERATVDISGNKGQQDTSASSVAVVGHLAEYGAWSPATVEGVPPPDSGGADAQELYQGTMPSVGLQVLASILDTSILNAMLLLPDTGALLRLVQQWNFVDLEAGSQALRRQGRYAELAALYQNQCHHDQGLEILRQVSQDWDSLPNKPTGVAADLHGLPGVWAAVRYLLAMVPPEVSVVQRHMPWILHADPEAGLEAFLQMQPPLPPTVVLPILQAHAPDYCAVYLEAAIRLGQASRQDYHSELLIMYLQMALAELQAEEPLGKDKKMGRVRSWSDYIDREGVSSAVKLTLGELLVNRPPLPLKLFPEDRSQWDISTSHTRELNGHEGASKGFQEDSEAPGASGPLPSMASRPRAYSRLRELVYTSPYIDPHYVLSKLPPRQLPEIRALMLERLGRHREALGLYLHGLRDLSLAEAYCDRIYTALETPPDHELSPSGAQGNLLRSIKGSGGLATDWEPGDVYIELLQSVLQGREDAEMDNLEMTGDTWREISSLLSRKRDRVDALVVLDLVPDEVLLKDFLPFVEAVLRLNTERTRNLSVVKNLQRSANLRVQEELIMLKQRSMLLTSERACTLCHKRIGPSVFVAYPNDTLAHYVCFKKTQPTSASETALLGV